MVVFALTVLLIAIIILLCTRHYRSGRRRRAELIDRIPGPRAFPIIGNVLSFLVPREELWELLRRMSFQYYPIYRTWIFQQPIVKIMHPDDLQELHYDKFKALLSSVKHTEKSRLYKFLHPWLGSGLLTSKGAKWQERRKILTPAFHFNVLQQFTAIFVEQATQLVESLEREGGEVVHDVLPFVATYTLNTICETAMGTSLDDLGETQKNLYRTSIEELGDIALYRNFRPWLHYDWIFSLFRKSRAQTEILDVLHGFSKKIIKERTQYHEQSDVHYLRTFSESTHVDDESNISAKKRLAMLDLMIWKAKNGARIDDVGIREEVDTFIFEGHDTTAVAMAFSLLLLAEHKDIQDKARAEINAVLEESGGVMTIREIQQLDYIERCIKESLRLFPSVPLISRLVNEDLQLKNYLIPGGTTVHVQISDLHRDANFWPNPNVFDPDRFLPEQIADRHPYAFVPFSAGPRNCIGRKFALLELKAMIGKLLHSFHLDPIDLSSEVRFIPHFVLRPTNPIRVKFTPITQS